MNEPRGKYQIAISDLNGWLDRNCSGTKRAVADKLARHFFDRSVTRWYAAVKKREKIEVDGAKLAQLARIVGRREADLLDQPFIKVVLRPPFTSEPKTPIKATADDVCRGYVYAVSLCSETLIGPQFASVRAFVDVFVDEVKMPAYMVGRNGTAPEPGHYIRLKPAAGMPGAVVLPIDPSTGDVLVATTYRHPIGRTITEIPRGRGLGGEDDPRATAARVLGLDGCAPLVGDDGKPQLFSLRRVHTDSGLLSHCPEFFLAFVDRTWQAKNLPAEPVRGRHLAWISLSAFYRAALAGGEVALSPQEVTFCHDEAAREATMGSLLDNYKLDLSDAFTLTAALLARPRLAVRFGPLVTDTIRVW